MLFGLVADTHGHLGEDVLRALAACDRILHAGDIGAGVLPKLERLAPVTAVRGNNDIRGPEANLPDAALIVAEGVGIALVHRRQDAPSWPWDILVCGHSHRVVDERGEGWRVINPGAAGRRGFHTARSVALLRIAAGAAVCEIVGLGPRKAAA